MDPFKPTMIGRRNARNKLVMAPMTTYSGNEDNTPSAEEIEYYKMRSRTVGAVITAAVAVNRQAHAFERQISLESDAFIGPMSELATAIKQEGALAIAQLHHGGRMNDPSVHESENEIVAPSAVKAPRTNKVTPRAMREDEIERTIHDFISAAVRAQKAGFDGVELHGANTYLLQQFFSRHSNRRNDRYGGSLENRLRFIDEIVRGTVDATKKETPEFIVGYRLSPEEIEDDGITLEDTDKLVDYLESQDLDYVHLSLRNYAQTSMRHPATKEPVLARLKRSQLLIASGGLDNRSDMERADTLGADLFALGTAILADPKAGLNLEKKGHADKVFRRQTMPENLYARLSKNASVFADNGFSFQD